MVIPNKKKKKAKRKIMPGSISEAVDGPSEEKPTTLLVEPRDEARARAIINEEINEDIRAIDEEGPKYINEDKAKQADEVSEAFGFSRPVTVSEDEAASVADAMTNPLFTETIEKQVGVPLEDRPSTVSEEGIACCVCDTPKRDEASKALKEGFVVKSFIFCPGCKDEYARPTKDGEIVRESDTLRHELDRLQTLVEEQSETIEHQNENIENNILYERMRDGEQTEAISKLEAYHQKELAEVRDQLRRQANDHVQTQREKIAEHRGFKEAFTLLVENQNT